MLFRSIRNRIWNHRGHFHHGIVLDGTVLILGAMFYAVNSYGLKTISSNVWIHDYANDLWAMPCMLAYSNLLIRICGKPVLLFVTIPRISSLTFVCAAVWEGLAPAIITWSVRDPFDMLAYASGASIYWMIGSSKQ